MQKITIENFGPVKHFEAEVKDVMLLIGPQASGKSSISKVIFFFKAIKDELMKFIYEVNPEELEHPINSFCLRLRQRFNDLFRENECTEFCDRRKELVVRDAGNPQEYRLLNPSKKELCKIRVDDCLIKDGEKCDYLVLNCEDKLAFFIELKGKDLLKAISQIDSSINILLSELPYFQIYARIVVNKIQTPAINSSAEIKLKKRLKKHNSDDSRDLVKYQSKIMEEEI